MVLTLVRRTSLFVSTNDADRRFTVILIGIWICTFVSPHPVYAIFLTGNQMSSGLAVVLAEDTPGTPTLDPVPGEFERHDCQSSFDCVINRSLGIPVSGVLSPVLTFCTAWISYISNSKFVVI